jgi:hypothetical protein
MSVAVKLPAPDGPLALDEVVRRYSAVRQSALSAADDCMLSAYFTLSHGQLWSTHPQGRGTIMHRAIAECLRTMVRQQEDSIPVSEALEILAETLWQRGVPDDELVRVPVQADRRAAPVRRRSSRATTRSTSGRSSTIEKRLAADGQLPAPGARARSWCAR